MTEEGPDLFIRVSKVTGDARGWTRIEDAILASDDVYGPIAHYVGFIQVRAARDEMRDENRDLLRCLSATLDHHDRVHRCDSSPTLDESRMRIRSYIPR